jgi:hypothetical protein
MPIRDSVGAPSRAWRSVLAQFLPALGAVQRGNERGFGLPLGPTECGNAMGTFLAEPTCDCVD